MSCADCWTCFRCERRKRVERVAGAVLGIASLGFVAWLAVTGFWRELALAGAASALGL